MTDIREQIRRMFESERMRGMVEVDGRMEAFSFNTPSLIEKWAEADLQELEGFHIKDLERLFEILGEGFMHDE